MHCTVQLAENHPHKARIEELASKLVAAEGEGAAVFARAAVSDLEGSLVYYNAPGFSPTVEQVYISLSLFSLPLSRLSPLSLASLISVFTML